MNSLEQRFERIYRPIMDAFAQKLMEREVSDYQGIPHPFLPIWGRNYERAYKKIAIVGKDTRGWGMDLETFLDKYKSGQYHFEDDRYEFRNLDFKDWNTSKTGSFWRFYMEVLAYVYGIENWTQIKEGKYDCLIDDFVWGNCYAIQLKNSEKTNPFAKGYDCALEYAQKYLNSIDYLEKVFSPDVVILTNAYYKPYLGDGWICEKKIDDKVLVLKRNKTVVFQCNHPNNMRFHSGGPKEYARILRDLLREYGFFFRLQGIKFFPEDKKDDLVNRIKDENDKYKAIEVVALMLRKYGCIMSAKNLSELLNNAGYKTKRGNGFTGNCQGPYRLISTAYDRAKTKDPDIADAIASSFTRANGTYAYK